MKKISVDMAYGAFGVSFYEAKVPREKRKDKQPIDRRLKKAKVLNRLLVKSNLLGSYLK